MPLIPALRRQREVDISEFEASLVYRVSSRTARATQRNPVSKNKDSFLSMCNCAHGHRVETLAPWELYLWESQML